ncbi:hypothetical protein BT69DRAFT_1355891 [Atractiella rhizophila]|nr:hypothetical protein BT69DRAFT_1355891 [Atractiella rhizophila]
MVKTSEPEPTMMPIPTLGKSTSKVLREVPSTPHHYSENATTPFALSSNAEHAYLLAESDVRGKFEEVSVEEILKMLPAPEPEQYSESRPAPRPIKISLPVFNENELCSQVITGFKSYLACDWHWANTTKLPDKTIHPVYGYTAVKPELVLYSAEAVAVEGNTPGAPHQTSITCLSEFSTFSPLP